MKVVHLITLDDDINKGRQIQGAHQNINVAELRAYQAMYIAGSLLYCATHTRPDVAYAAGMLCRAMSRPTPALYKSALRVLYYICISIALWACVMSRPLGHLPASLIRIGLCATQPLDTFSITALLRCHGAQRNSPPLPYPPVKLK